ncbi:unnamed protein product [Cunninghamella echinulata]
MSKQFFVVFILLIWVVLSVHAYKCSDEQFKMCKNFNRIAMKKDKTVIGTSCLNTEARELGKCILKFDGDQYSKCGVMELGRCQKMIKAGIQDCDWRGNQYYCSTSETKKKVGILDIINYLRKCTKEGNNLFVIKKKEGDFYYYFQ